LISASVIRNNTAIRKKDRKPDGANPERGSKISIKEISTIKELTGPAFIFRDNNMRYIAVKFSVRGRDLGSTIAEAQQKVKATP
jgi:Cu/Ag efflux pump CusA